MPDRRCSALLLLGWFFFASASPATADDTPQLASVRDMKKVADAGEWKKLYDEHCHPHLQKQLNAEEFSKYMASDKGKAIVAVLGEVLAAVDGKADEATLIARENEKDKSEYEFILVKVKGKAGRKGQQWHLELKLDDSKWKLMDTD